MPIREYWNIKEIRLGDLGWIGDWNEWNGIGLGTGLFVVCSYFDQFVFGHACCDFVAPSCFLLAVDY